MSLFRRAAVCAATGDSTKDPLSLCGHARLLLAPYRRSRPAYPLQASPLPCADRNEGGGQTSSSGRGTAAIAARPETDAAQSSLPMAPKVEVPPTGAPASAAEEAWPLVFPSDEEKNEAARLLARAFSSAGGAMPPENVYFGSQVDDEVGGRKGGDDGVVERGRAGGGGDDQTVLAEVHLAVSGFSLKEGRGGGRGGDGAKEWHLQEAARVAPRYTKTGITARCVSALLVELVREVRDLERGVAFFFMHRSTSYPVFTAVGGS